MNTKAILVLVLFTAFMMLVPSLYIIFVAGGFLPPIFYLYFILGSGEQPIATIWLIHLIVYSGINLLISYIVIKLFICKKYAPTKCMISTFIVITVLIMLSFLPIYSIGTHSSSKGVNIVGVYKLAHRISYLPWGRK